MRHVDAGYEEAIECAKELGVKIPMLSSSFRAGASPAPTIHGLGGPLRRMVGATLAVALVSTH